jgi:hypothetical protein
MNLIENIFEKFEKNHFYPFLPTFGGNLGANQNIPRQLTIVNYFLTMWTNILRHFQQKVMNEIWNIFENVQKSQFSERNALKFTFP